MASKDIEKGQVPGDVFPVSLEDLCEMMKERTAETLQKLQDPHGGVLGLARRIGVDPSKGTSKRSPNSVVWLICVFFTGLVTSDSADFAKRESQYGKNVIPPKKPKSFIQLCWEACQDLTLIILICASLFSFILALVVPHDDKDGG